jgi:LacI family transcriptional regulator
VRGSRAIVDGISNRRAGMREVAELAGVAVSSVSRVVSGHPDVSPAMRHRVLAAVSSLGYQPDFLAQSLRRGATLTVGFIASDISNPLMAEIASGIESVLKTEHYSLVVMNSGLDPGQEASNIEFLNRRRVDGMILSLSSERKKETIKALRDLRVPIVVVDRDLPARLNASSVISDHRTGVFAATTDLLTLGHRKIGLVTGPLDTRPARERLAGVREATLAAGLPDAYVYRTHSFAAEYGDAATEELLALAPAPSAIIAGGNQILVGCLRTFRRHGLRVGTDVALVTCDEVPLAELFNPPIAAVVRDNSAMGRAAAQLLLERMRDSGGARQVVIPTAYVHRDSACPPPTRVNAAQ